MYLFFINTTDAHFTGQWLGRGGPIEWSPRSCDLTPLDYFLWGYIKSKVYINRPKTLHELKVAIRDAINSITEEMLINVINAWEMRLRHCIANEGKQFEHLL